MTTGFPQPSPPSPRDNGDVESNHPTATPPQMDPGTILTQGPVSPADVTVGPVRKVDPRTLEEHETAAFLPEMQDDEKQWLKESIEHNGVLQPLLLVDGKVFDGRHRRKAAIACGLKEVPVRDLELGDVMPEELVASINLLHRHLTSSQKAMFGARLVHLYVEGGKQRMQLGKKADEAEIGRSADKAAKVVGASASSIKSALKVLRREIPKVHHAVENGTLTVSMARNLVELHPEPTHDKYLCFLADGDPEDVPKKVGDAVKLQRARNGFTDDRDGEPTEIDGDHLDRMVLFLRALDQRVGTLKKVVEWLEAQTSSTDTPSPGRLLIANKSEIVGAIQTVVDLLEQARPSQL